MKLTIRAKLSLFFVTLAVVPMMGVALVSYYNSIGSVERVVEQRSASLVGEIRADLDGLSLSLKSDARLLARNRAIQELYSHYESNGQAALEEGRPAIERFLRQFIDGAPYTFARFSYLDNKGNLVLQFARNAEAEVVGEEYAFATEDISIEIGNLSPSKNDTELSVANRYENSTGSLLRLAYPIRRLADGDVAGTVVADIEVSSLLEQTGHPAIVAAGRLGRHARALALVRRVSSSSPRKA
jgi:hypothetical protein